MTNVLVTYDSKKHATTEIAEFIGKTLKNAGLEVKVIHVDLAANLNEFDAVLVGSAVYYGQWMKAAANFLKENAATLAKKDVWLFSSGPTGEGDPVALLEGWQFPENLKDVVDQIAPHDITVFNGRVAPDKLNFGERFIINMVKSPKGDYRNWDAICAWAQTIAETLTVTEPQT